MHITKVYVNAFKSLAQFSLDLSSFNCLIGLNGCGKSTVLQCFDFLSHLLGGDLVRWFELREWDPRDVRNVPGDWGNIDFSLEFSDGSEWSGRYNILKQQCISEDIFTPAASIRLSEGKLSGLAPESEFLGKPVDQPKMSVQGLAYRGSVTSIFDEDALPPSVLELRRFFQRTHVFDTLSPQFLRRKDKRAYSTIGHSGEHLSAHFAELPEATRDDILRELTIVYPRLRDLSTQSLQGGWKELLVRELYKPSAISTASRHINDGLLRILAILTELRSDSSFSLFDEIENGVNPEIVEFLVGTLTKSPRQVLVTTHSPMILNYLDDETARESVVFLHKGADGQTRATRFFDIPSVREKLDVMGPGEAFVDTNLIALSDELNAAGVE